MNLTADDRTILDALRSCTPRRDVTAAELSPLSGVNYDRTVRSLRWLRTFGHVERRSKGYRALTKVTTRD